MFSERIFAEAILNYFQKVNKSMCKMKIQLSLRNKIMHLQPRKP